MILLLESITSIFSFQELSHKAIPGNTYPENPLGFRPGAGGDGVVNRKGSMGNMPEKHSISFPPFGIQIRILKALRSPAVILITELFLPIASILTEWQVVHRLFKD